MFTFKNKFYKRKITMKKLFLILVGISLWFSIQVAAQETIPNRIIVKFHSQIKKNQPLPFKKKFVKRIKFQNISQPFASSKSESLNKIYFIDYSGNIPPKQLSILMEKENSVEWAEPDYKGKLAGFTPNDSLYSEQWYLNKIGMENAWALQQSNSNIVVAVIDNGITLNHPELQNVIWTNPNETENGLDDDGNGLVDDIHGWDFGDSDNNVSHDGTFFHGTQVAGIIAAETDNNIGIASVAFGSTILPIKVTETSDPATVIMSDAYQAIVYAANENADVINCSWGNYQYSHLGKEAVDYALSQGAVVIAAAGNDGSNDVFYPAKYNNVLSVGATQSDDIVWNASNRGYYLDVLAPGENILSLSGAPNYYETASGTSLASPIVSGIAALVKAKFPELSPRQIEERIRVTAENVYSQNPGLENMLGFGRVNAEEALSATLLKSVRATNFTFSDNDNNIAEPGDTIRLKINFRNYLSSLNNLNVTLSTSDENISIINSVFNAGVVNSTADFDNTNNEFIFTISNSVPENHKVYFLLTYTDDFYVDFQWTELSVNPTYLDMNLNNITLTLTSDGRLGFTDYPYNQKGSGLFYKNDNLIRFFEAGFLYGTSPTSVNDNLHEIMYGAQSGDFSELVPLSINIPGTEADQEGKTSFNDNPSATHLGIKTDLYSYEYSSPQSENYVILRYVLHNNSNSRIDNLYAGLFFDWDLDENDYSDDIVAYDSSGNFGYAFDSGFNTISTYQGVGLISDNAYNFYAITNDGSDGGITIDPFSKADKWTALSSGLNRTSAGPSDISFVVSGGPYSIEPNQFINVAFAVAITDNLDEMRSAISDAKTKYAQLPLSVNDNFLPTKFELSQNYPNPFSKESGGNPTTTIKYSIPNTSVIARSGEASTWQSPESSVNVTLTVYDILGRKVATLVNENKVPGNYSVQFNAGNLPSGVYFYQLQAGSLVATKKMILMK